MKITIALSFFILVNMNVFAQHTENFLNMSNQLKFVDSTKIETRFSNGNIKEIKTIIKYEYNGYLYTFKTGENRFYSKKGQKDWELKYDLFGNVLSDKSFNSHGNVYKENNTVKIDTDAKSVNEFLKSKELRITSYEKEYTNNSYDNLWLYKEGMRLNGKKIGIWKEYCRDELKKETSFD